MKFVIKLIVVSIALFSVASYAEEPLPAGESASLTPERAKEAEALKQLLICYSDGTDLELAEVMKKSDAFIANHQTTQENTYKAQILAAGSFLGIADRVSQECDKAFVARNLSMKPVEIQKMAGIVFIQKMKAFDMSFMKTCDVGLQQDGLETLLQQNCQSRRQKIKDLKLYQ